MTACVHRVEQQGRLSGEITMTGIFELQYLEFLGTVQQKKRKFLYC
jgi:hypothetical protein